MSHFVNQDPPTRCEKVPQLSAKWTDLNCSYPFGSDMMKLGASVSWQDALETIAGTRKMSAAPLIEYFAPLYEWLKKQNKGRVIGWSDACPPGLVDES